MTLRVSSTSAVLRSQIHGHFNVDPATTTGLTFGFTTGRVSFDTHTEVVAAGTVPLTDNATNYIYTTDGSVGVGTSIASGAIHMLYEIVTASGVITTITDLRGAYV